MPGVRQCYLTISCVLFSVPRIQDILRETMPGSAPQAVPKQKTTQRKSTLVKNNEAPSSSFCDSAQRYYRSKTNAAAQANSMTIQTETGTMPNEHLPAFVGGGGGNIIETDDKSLKPSERLEACINSMMKKAEMLHPSPEEQILQKQQILEELQRVERELQEKAHAQLLLTAQHQHQHQQQHHHQGIQIGTIVTGTPTISTITNNNNSNNNANSLSNLATVAGVHAQQLIFNTDAVLDIESLSSLTDISSVSNHMGLNLHLTTSANNLAFPPAVHPPQQLYNLSQQPPQQVQKVVQQSVITTTTPAADYCKSRMGKLAKQAKTVMKQNSQQPFKIPPPILLHQNDSSTKVDPQTIPIMEDSEKMNLRSVVYNDQQHPQTHLQQQQQQATQQHQQQQIQLQQQLLHQHSQQQFVLSEFTQNLTLRNTKYCEGAIAGVLHAMGGIKLTESTQTHTIPMYDAVTVGNVLKQQQPHLIQPQQLQIIPQEQPSPQSLPLQPLPPQPQHFEKNVKLVKGKTNKVQQQSLLHTNPMSLTSMQPSQQAIKQQLSSCNETCTTLVGSIPLDGTSVLTLSGMASPAFPVSIAVTPVSIPTTVSISTNCGAFAHNLALDEGLMVAAPARTLHETLGEIMTGKWMVLVFACLNSVIL